MRFKNEALQTHFAAGCEVSHRSALPTSFAPNRTKSRLWPVTIRKVTLPNFANRSRIRNQKQTSLEVFQNTLEAVRNKVEERTWLAFWRTTVDEQSAPDIADELGMTGDDVRKAKSRMKIRLRLELGAIFDEIVRDDGVILDYDQLHVFCAGTGALKTRSLPWCPSCSAPKTNSGSAPAQGSG